MRGRHSEVTKSTPQAAVRDLAVRIKLELDAAKRDLTREYWVTCENHVETYNSLLRGSLAYDINGVLLPVVPVSQEARPLVRLPSDIEKATLAEIVDRLEVLYHTVAGHTRAGGQRIRRSAGRPLALIDRLLDRFPLLAHQLGTVSTRAGRYQITNEYRVQKLIHGLLQMHFDDVVPEEWTPSYAGSSARMDFLIRPIGVVIETKMTRTGLGAKELGDQLIIDIKRYSRHPACRVLFCFVYDPGRYLDNPRGIEEDLGRESSGKLKVSVIVRS